MLKDVVAVVGDRVAAFELGVVSEVFGLDHGAALPAYDFAVCAVRPGLVPTTSGFSVHVEHGLERLESADLIAVPAWTCEPVPPPAPLVAALHRAIDRGGRLMTVCSGAFLLAAAGLLDGRRAATHWRYASELAARHPAVVVDPHVLYVVDGPILTSAGTAAGIDACLHVVREEHSASAANALRRRRFKAATGTTPYRWLLDQRLLLAERLLEDTDLPIDAVAARSGLGSADTLRHHVVLRRRTSPQAYRRSFRNAVPG